MSRPCEHWHCLTLRINGCLHSYCVACGSWGEDTLCGFCQNDWSHGTLEKFLDKRLWYFWRPEAVIIVNIKPIAPDVRRRYHILIIGDAGVPCRVSHKHVLSDQACMHVCIMGLDTLTASLYAGGHCPAPPPLWLDFQNQLDLVLTCFRDWFWLYTTTF